MTPQGPEPVSRAQAEVSQGDCNCKLHAVRGRAWPHPPSPFSVVFNRVKTLTALARAPSAATTQGTVRVTIFCLCHVEPGRQVAPRGRRLAPSCQRTSFSHLQRTESDLSVREKQETKPLGSKGPERGQPSTPTVGGKLHVGATVGVAECQRSKALQGDLQPEFSN